MFRVLLRRLRGGGDERSTSGDERAVSGDEGPSAADADDRGDVDGASDGDGPGEAGADGGDAGDGTTDAGSDADTDDDQYLWDLIPRWQYDGRHVESGGQATKEQERALEDIQRQAEAIEAQEGVDAPVHDDGP